jgi:hypothetical protein
MLGAKAIALALAGASLAGAAPWHWHDGPRQASAVKAELKHMRTVRPTCLIADRRDPPYSDCARIG